MRFLRGMLHVRWLFPFRRIAASLEELVALYRMDLESRGVVGPGDAGVASVTYQDDISISEGERKRLEWIARGGPPLMEGEQVPGPLPQ